MNSSITFLIKQYKNWFIYAGILVIGILVGSLLTNGGASEQDTQQGHDHEEQVASGDEESTVYTCSMHPSVRQDEPGQCPICGMDLIPAKDSKSSSNNEADAYSMEMTETAAKIADIQTSPVEYGKVVREVRLPGRVEVDERLINSVSAQFPGRIEELYVNFTGQRVEKGDKLASVYSSELITAQKELLEAKEAKESQPGIYKAARQKLKQWKLSEKQIDDIAESNQVQSNVDIESPVDGYVLKRRVSGEDHINKGTVLYKVADLSRLWITFEAYEDQIEGIEEGDQVDFKVKAYPGEQFEAKVSFIDPVLDPSTRTITVRAVVDNNKGKLKPQMLATGFVESTLYDGEPKMMVPSSAVMWTGKRSVVFVDKSESGNPSFSGRQIEIGPKVNDRYVVLAGLRRSESVVSSGTFKLDAAAQLAGKFSMMQQQKGSGTPVELASATVKNDMSAQGGGDHTSHKSNGGSMASNEKNQNTNKTVQVGKDSLKTHPAPDEFKEQILKTVEAYLELKDALVASDSENASSSASAFLNTLEQVDMKLLEHEPHMTWMKQLEKLKAEAGKINESSELDVQRKAFSPLSNTMVEVVKTFEIQGAGYRQFCPMAHGDGAYWLSTQEEIRNPYYGEKMMGCGEVVEKL